MSLVEVPRHSLTPMEILSNAVDGGADVATLSQLLTLQERWEKNEARKAFDNAMAEAKAVMPTIRKNRNVGFESKRTGDTTSYRHEDLAEIAQTVTPILSQHGLSYRFRTASPPDGPVSVTCIISHRLGYSEENTLSAPADTSGKKNGIQAVGSTVTYLQRYTLKAALGLAAAEDKDGATPEEESPQITDEQLATLQAKIDATETDIALFCEYMRVDSLKDLTIKGFTAAIAALDAKAKAKGVAQ